MSFSGGLYLTLLIGENVPAPAPEELMQAVQKVEVTVTNETSGFQIVFSAGRNSSAEASEYALLDNPSIKLFNRIIIMVSFGVDPKVLIDGIILNHQFNPSREPGKTTFTITGLDLSVMMDFKKERKPFPNSGHADIVEQILKNYTKYGLEAKIIPPDSPGTPMENNSIPAQLLTDLQYIRKLAGLHELAGKKYVFYIEPTVSGEGIAYWGPPDYKGPAQGPLSFNMDEFTNVNSLNFGMDALKQSTLEGPVQNPEDGKTVDVKSPPPNSDEKLAKKPITDFIDTTKQIVNDMRGGSGISVEEAINKAKVEKSKSSEAVTLTGELDTLRYGDVLKARHLVALRGVGQSYNGLYYVKKVTHTITKGSYKQNFTLTREGLGSTIQTVKMNEQ